MFTRAESNKRIERPKTDHQMSEVQSASQDINYVLCFEPPSIEQQADHFLLWLKSTFFRAVTVYPYVFNKNPENQYFLSEHAPEILLNIARKYKKNTLTEEDQTDFTEEDTNYLENIFEPFHRCFDPSKEFLSKMEMQQHSLTPERRNVFYRNLSKWYDNLFLKRMFLQMRWQRGDSIRVCEMMYEKENGITLKTDEQILIETRLDKLIALIQDQKIYCNNKERLFCEAVLKHLAHKTTTQLKDFFVKNSAVLSEYANTYFSGKWLNFKNPTNSDISRRAMQTAIRAHRRNPFWLSLCAYILDPNYSNKEIVPFIPHKECRAIRKNARENLEALFNDLSEPLVQHLVRLIYLCSSTESCDNLQNGLTTYDQSQLNAYIMANLRDAGVSSKQPESMSYDINTILGYLACYGIHFSCSEGLTEIISWFDSKKQSAEKLVHALADDLMDADTSNMTLSRTIQWLLTKGATFAITNAPAIVMGLVTLGALLGKGTQNVDLSPQVKQYLRERRSTHHFVAKHLARLMMIHVEHYLKNKEPLPEILETYADHIFEKTDERRYYQLSMQTQQSFRINSEGHKVSYQCLSTEMLSWEKIANLLGTDVFWVKHMMRAPLSKYLSQSKGAEDLLVDTCGTLERLINSPYGSTLQLYDRTQLFEAIDTFKSEMSAKSRKVLSAWHAYICKAEWIAKRQKLTAHVFFHPLLFLPHQHILDSNHLSLLNDLKSRSGTIDSIVEADYSVNTFSPDNNSSPFVFHSALFFNEKRIVHVDQLMLREDLIRKCLFDISAIEGKQFLDWIKPQKKYYVLNMPLTLEKGSALYEKFRAVLCSAVKAGAISHALVQKATQFLISWPKELKPILDKDDISQMYHIKLVRLADYHLRLNYEKQHYNRQITRDNCIRFLETNYPKRQWVAQDRWCGLSFDEKPQKRDKDEVQLIKNENASRTLSEFKPDVGKADAFYNLLFYFHPGAIATYIKDCSLRDGHNKDYQGYEKLFSSEEKYKLLYKSLFFKKKKLASALLKDNDIQSIFSETPEKFVWLHNRIYHTHLWSPYTKYTFLNLLHQTTHKVRQSLRLTEMLFLISALQKQNQLLLMMKKMMALLQLRPARSIQSFFGRGIWNSLFSYNEAFLSKKYFMNILQLISKQDLFAAIDLLIEKTQNFSLKERQNLFLKFLKKVQKYLPIALSTRYISWNSQKENFFMQTWSQSKNFYEKLSAKFETMGVMERSTELMSRNPQEFFSEEEFKKYSESKLYKRKQKLKWDSIQDRDQQILDHPNQSCLPFSSVFSSAMSVEIEGMSLGRNFFNYPSFLDALKDPSSKLSIFFDREENTNFIFQMLSQDKKTLYLFDSLAEWIMRKHSLTQNQKVWFQDINTCLVAKYCKMKKRRENLLGKKTSDPKELAERERIASVLQQKMDKLQSFFTWYHTHIDSQMILDISTEYANYSPDKIKNRTYL